MNGAPHLEAMTVCRLEARVDDALVRRRSDDRNGKLRLAPLLEPHTASRT